MKQTTGQIKSFDGTEIAYESTKADSPRGWLVLLHGLGGDLAAWTPERTIFAKNHYSTIAVDLRGHGLSGRPPDEAAYALHDVAHDIEVVTTTLKIPKPVLVGHCFGGLVALTAAADFPHLFSSLVLVDTSYKPPFLALSKTDTRLASSVIHTLTSVLPAQPGTDHADFRTFKGTADIDPKRFLSDISHTSLKSYLLSGEQLLNFNGRSVFSKIEIPTLIIHGNEDSLFPPRIAFEIADRLKDAHVEIILGANHVIVLNKPADLCSAILDFLGHKP